MAQPIPPETLAWFGGDELRARVFIDKYALRGTNDELLETTPDQMWDRVAREIASVEETEALRREWEEKFRWLLEDFRMIPGGRILFAAGNPRRATASNCYVIPILEDSIEGIFQWCKEAARTYSLGGGCGVDISVLRPRGSPVNNAARHSTGAVSFMELFSLTTGTIGQRGRRGALMITISSDHPDVLEFCRVKRDQKSVRYANISVRVTDAFMRAVEADGRYLLRFHSDKAHVEREIRARDLWRELIEGAWGWAEPGVIFWDTMKRWSTSEYNGMEIITTNPCSEIPLEPYGSCNLANVNLARFVLDPFTDRARVDREGLERALRCTVRFLDNVVDWNMDRHPLPQQKEAIRKSRRIGVGFTGLADMLVQLRLRYDSEEAGEFVHRMFNWIKNIVYDESANIAAEKGTFPAYDRERHLGGLFLRTLAPEVINKVQTVGLRNVALLTVPPVGSGAALAGVTSGIEPIFDLSYTRRSESLSKEHFTVFHPLARRYMDEFGVDDPEKLPDYFVTSHRIRPEMRVRMQAAIQAHIDHSISSTVNLPENATFEDVERIYLLAWKLGCKGITVYRSGSRENILTPLDEGRKGEEGAVKERESITVVEPAEDAVAALADRVTRLAAQAMPDFTPDGRSPEERIEHAVRALLDRLRAAAPGQLQLVGEAPVLRPRPSVLYGVTLPQKAPEGNIQVTLNEVDGEPFELIVHGGKAGSDILAIVQALARAASVLLRLQRLPSQTERLELLIEQWKGIKGSRQLGLGPNAVYSAPDAIAQALERYLDLKRGAAPEETPPVERPEGRGPVVATNGNMCPRCHRFALVTEEGCTKCVECGFKEC